MELTYPTITIAVLAATFAAIILLDRSGSRRYLRQTTMIGLAVSFCGLLFPASAGALLHTDPLSRYFAVLVVAIALLVLLASHEASFIYLVSILLSTIGMILVITADDVLLLYISIELMTAPTYALVAYRKHRLRIEAATKYFINGIVASSLLVLGLALLVSAVGTTSISQMIPIISAGGVSPLLYAGVAAILAGFTFKLGLFPGNLWVPDVYQGAPSEVSGFLAAATKKAAFAALLWLALAFVRVGAWTNVTMLLAAVTMVAATVLSLMQQDLRRLLAYSSLAHAGFLMLGVAAGTTAGRSAVALHSLVHAAMILGAFLIAGLLYVHKIETIEQLKGLGWRNKLLSFSLMLFLLSMAGIPLLSGFIGKFSLILAVFDAGMLWLGLLAIMMSVLALYPYFRVIRALYGYPVAKGTSFPLHNGVLFVILLCLMITIVIGIVPGPFFQLAQFVAG